MQKRVLATTPAVLLDLVLYPDPRASPPHKWVFVTIEHPARPYVAIAHDDDTIRHRSV